MCLDTTIRHSRRRTHVRTNTKVVDMPLFTPPYSGSIAAWLLPISTDGLTLSWRGISAKLGATANSESTFKQMEKLIFQVEVELLDLEDQPPVNQCHSLSSTTAAPSRLYNVWLWDSQQLCLLHSAVWGERRRRRRWGMQNGWQPWEEAIEIVIMRVEGSGWSPAPPLYSNPIMTGSVSTGDPCAAAAGLTAACVSTAPKYYM